MLKSLVGKVLKPYGRSGFLSRYGKNSKILDVGCGNRSALLTKAVCGACFYVGVDISESTFANEHADKFVLADPLEFSSAVEAAGTNFDLVVSSHNLEHCFEPAKVLTAMLEALRPGGRIFISFPSEASLQFPSRRGTLNYFDDPTHQVVPPMLSEVTKFLRSQGFLIEFQSSRYRPFWLMVFGLIIEPISRLKGRVLPGTWEFWGFESIVVAKKEQPKAFCR